jgi:aspartate aminotransferase/aromatic-amino-acid transaminase
LLNIHGTAVNPLLSADLVVTSGRELKKEETMFENVRRAPPDAIFGLSEAMREDPRPEKINLGAGVYKDEAGKTPVLAAVKEAERRIWERESTKAYLPIEGSTEYAGAIRSLLFGEDHEAIAARGLATLHTPGGTGALRVMADFVKSLRPGATVRMSDPTWPNHPQVFAAAGLRMESYPYYDRSSFGLDFERMLAALAAVAEGDVVLLHGCCHNPTGVDLSLDEWSALGEELARRRALPLVDFAYQGFSEGLVEDVAWLRVLCAEVEELAVCSSFSKNFGLYNERVGALTVVAQTAEAARAVESQLKRVARATYSNPPGHGGAIVTTILGDTGLRRQWEEELAAMRGRIRRIRRLFVDGLDARGVKLHPSGNEFIARQNGMFSFSGLDPEQVARIREEAAVYMVSSGRVNVAGMTESNMDRLCDAMASVCLVRAAGGP